MSNFDFDDNDLIIHVLRIENRESIDKLINESNNTPKNLKICNHCGTPHDDITKYIKTYWKNSTKNTNEKIKELLKFVSAHICDK